MTTITTPKVHMVHPNNPFVYRLECPAAHCVNIVWPDEIIDVSNFPVELRGEDTQRCSGCIETWLREGRLTHTELLALRGANSSEIEAFETKCSEAKPAHTFID